VLTTGKPIAEVDDELGIYDTTPGNWVRRHQNEHAAGSGLDPGERARLKELEAENGSFGDERGSGPHEQHGSPARLRVSRTSPRTDSRAARPYGRCQLLVGLGDISVLAVLDSSPTTPPPVACASSGAIATIKDRPAVAVVDLPAFGRPTRLLWIKRLVALPGPADLFHVVSPVGEKFDLSRRMQQETLEHRSRKHDPLHRVRRLLVLAHLEEHATVKLTGLLAVDDPRGEVATAWHANEVVRELYAHRDESVALGWVDQLSADMRGRDCPPEVRQLGRTCTGGAPRSQPGTARRSPTGSRRAATTSPSGSTGSRG
jgi:transposase-like protein